MRFGLLAMSSTQDVRFSEEKVPQGQALANKLFNATRFVLLQRATAGDAAPRPQTVEDRWILVAPAARRRPTPPQLDGFDFAKLALGLYDFVYGELCDWYLELVKGRDFDEDLSATLLHVLRETLLARPPYDPVRDRGAVGALPGTEGLLAAARRRAADDVAARRRRPSARSASAIDARARGARAGATARGVEPGDRAAGGARPTGPTGGRRVARLARLECEAPAGAVRRSRRRRRGRAGGGVDPEEDARQRAGERARMEAEIDRAEGKLANQGFVAKAPAEVVRPSATSSRAARGARGAVASAAAGRSPTPSATCSALELFGMRFGLDRMRRLMTALGPPQERFASIHVVGRTARPRRRAWLAAILERHGLRTGTYLSPHLVSFTERVRIGGADIPPRRSAPRCSAPRRPPSWSNARGSATTASRSSRR